LLPSLSKKFYQKKQFLAFGIPWRCCFRLYDNSFSLWT